MTQQKYNWKEMRGVLKLEKFKQVYELARAHGPNYIFEFDGHEFVVGYARYLIEYLDSRMT